MTTPVNNLGITPASFVIDWPQFRNQAQYPPAAIAFFIAWVNIFMNPMFWGGPSGNAGCPTASPPVPISPTNPPQYQIDIAAELLVAHLLTLEYLAQKQAAAGAPSGLQTGAVAGKTVGPISISFDNAISSLEGAAEYNLTIYGKMFYRMMMMFGAGPTQLGLGVAPPWSAFTPSSFGPWAGPPMWPGWFWNT